MEVGGQPLSRGPWGAGSYTPGPCQEEAGSSPFTGEGTEAQGRRCPRSCTGQ